MCPDNAGPSRAMTLAKAPRLPWGRAAGRLAGRRPRAAGPLSGRRDQRDRLLIDQAPSRAAMPTTTPARPRNRWWPCPFTWLPTFRKLGAAPVNQSTPTTKATTPMTARTMTSGRLEPAPPETLPELTFFLLGKTWHSAGSLTARGGLGLLRSPAGGPSGDGVDYVRQRTTKSDTRTTDFGKVPGNTRT